MFKSNKAITLIALVITIVLLILAAVTLNIVLGENGIFGKARLAKEKQEYASAKEILDTRILDIQTECAINGEEYSLKKAAEKIEPNTETQIMIEKYYADSIAKKLNSAGEEPLAIKGIVVSVEKYTKFKFLIGKNGEVISLIGVSTSSIAETWTSGDLPEGFVPLSEFEQILGGTEEETIEDGQVNAFTISKNNNSLVKDTTFTIAGSSTTRDINKIELYLGNVLIYKEENIHTNNYNKTVGLNNLINLDQINYGETYEVKAVLTQINSTTTEATTTSILNKTIGNASSLVKFSNIVNGENGETQNSFTGEEIIQVADIDLTGITWTPIGNFNKNFDGTFDGNNKKIQGLTISNSGDRVIALFGVTSSNSIIKNLSLYGTITQNANRASGGIVAVNYGEIDRCINYAGISSSSAETGGIVGNNHGLITNCTNEGNISGVSYIGGINGHCYDDASNISNCTNKGNVTATTSTTGGIVGYSSKDIISCKNETGTNIQSSSSPSDFQNEGTGGIVGVTTANVSLSYNKGSISATGYCAGGIVGHGSINTIVQQCFNVGNVVASQNLAGGIVGRRAKEINNCYNYIKGQTVISSKCNTAGIIANCSDVGVSINNCYSIGDNITSTGTGNENSVGLAIAALYNSGITVNKFYYLDSSSIAVYGSENIYPAAEQNVNNKSDSTFKLPASNTSSVTYLLNPTTGNAIWAQDNNINDGYPYLVNNH